MAIEKNPAPNASDEELLLSGLADAARERKLKGKRGTFDKAGNRVSIKKVKKVKRDVAGLAKTPEERARIAAEKAAAAPRPAVSTDPGKKMGPLDTSFEELSSTDTRSAGELRKAAVRAPILSTTTLDPNKLPARASTGMSVEQSSRAARNVVARFDEPSTRDVANPPEVRTLAASLAKNDNLTLDPIALDKSAYTTKARVLHYGKITSEQLNAYLGARPHVATTKLNELHDTIMDRERFGRKGGTGYSFSTTNGGVKDTDLWEHPTTKEVHPVSHMHKDMPVDDKGNPTFNRSEVPFRGHVMDSAGEMRPFIQHEGYAPIESRDKAGNAVRIWKFKSVPEGAEHDADTIISAIREGKTERGVLKDNKNADREARKIAGEAPKVTGPSISLPPALQAQKDAEIQKHDYHITSEVRDSKNCVECAKLDSSESRKKAARIATNLAAAASREEDRFAGPAAVTAPPVVGVKGVKPRVMVNKKRPESEGSTTSVNVGSGRGRQFTQDTLPGINPSAFEPIKGSGRQIRLAKVKAQPAPSREETPKAPMDMHGQPQLDLGPIVSRQFMGTPVIPGKTRELNPNESALLASVKNSRVLPLTGRPEVSSEIDPNTGQRKLRESTRKA